MSFFIIREVIAWGVWLVFADKKRWRELFLVGMFAGFLGASTDNVLVFDLRLWDYFPKTRFTYHLLDDWGIYMIVTYLFIQFLPRRRTFWRMIGYWFFWTAVSLGIEWVHVKTGHMIHNRWWNLGYSYLCDWFLFWVFYQFHKLFRLEEAFRGVR